ncbi:MAG: alanine--tRNA ligase [Halobacteria archaeon]
MEDEYRLDYFEEKGFVRNSCPGCGRHYWTRDPDSENCGEPPCSDYSFIHNPPFEESYEIDEMREEFLSFFESREHTRIDPYPVDASRWRDDVLLTQASIYDFQPLVTGGYAPPPANPLCISQPCIRMQDIDNVGKTGRHTLAFEMMAHHCFNSRSEGGPYEGEEYWKEDTVRFCDEFLEHLGAPMDEITYVESPWVGGGNAGPAFEVILRGAELATLVFMDMEQDPDGDVEMKDGNLYSKMDNYIVDTGYGLERLTWVSQGTPTVYEAIYPDMVELVLEKAGIQHSAREDEILKDVARVAGKLDTDEVEDLEEMRRQVADDVGMSLEELDEVLKPLENTFAIADHSRVLAYMLGDGIVPSNVGTGYLARLVLRRTIRLMDEIDIETSLSDLVTIEAENLGYKDLDTITEMVDAEVEKYRDTLERGERLVRREAEKYAEGGDGEIPVEALVEFYDSHGLHPEIVEEVAEDEGVDVEKPDDFYSKIAERHEDREKADRVQEFSVNEEDVENLPETDSLYYEDPERSKFEAVVLDVLDAADDGYNVVLDQTLFYPEGGGQPPDTGVIENSEVVHVDDVQEVDGVILHHTDKDPGSGDVVTGHVDFGRRSSLMKHHTATHIVIDAARKVLGSHVRQAGAQKGVDSSRIDITHHKRISEKELQEIEMEANRTVMENIQVQDKWLDRHEAEDTYGFGLYQGGIPAGEEIRIIEVDEDVQACGGTHVNRSGDVGYIKIRNTERIQDGVERLEFSAAEKAVEAVQKMESYLDEASEVFGVPYSEVPDSAQRFFREWKERGKELQELKSELAEVRTMEAEELTVEGVPVVVERMDGDIDEVRAAVNKFVDEGKVAVLVSGDSDGKVVAGVPDDVDLDAGDIVGEVAPVLGGGGGGSPDFAQGGGPEGGNADEAVDEAREVVKGGLQDG